MPLNTGIIPRSSVCSSSQLYLTSVSAFRMMSVYPSCMQRPGIPGLGIPLSIPWTFPAAPLSQAVTLQVQIPRPVIATQSLPKDSMEPKSVLPIKPKPSPTTKSTPTSFTIASILSKTDDRDKHSRNSPVVSQPLNATGHASAAAGSISPSTPLSASPKTPLYYISYHPAAQPSPFSFPAAQSSLDHELQRSPLSRIAGAPAPLTLGDCIGRRYGKSSSSYLFALNAACEYNFLLQRLQVI